MTEPLRREHEHLRRGAWVSVALALVCVAGFLGTEYSHWLWPPLPVTWPAALPATAVLVTLVNADGNADQLVQAAVHSAFAASPAFAVIFVNVELTDPCVMVPESNSGSLSLRVLPPHCASPPVALAHIILGANWTSVLFLGSNLTECITAWAAILLHSPQSDVWQTNTVLVTSITPTEHDPVDVAPTTQRQLAPFLAALRPCVQLQLHTQVALSVTCLD
jgi:hypothetical protein